MCELRKKVHLQKGYVPKGNIDTITEGAYYLTEVNDLYQRKYEVKV